MKILILGNGRHGKDTFADMLHQIMGLTFESSSRAAAEICVYPAMRNKYANAKECYEDRRNHRAEWKRLITEYNTPDKSRLCKEILERSDCYVGMRCQQEYEASRWMFDYVFWVDASKRLPDDPTMKIEPEHGMNFVDNNGSKIDLWAQAVSISRALTRTELCSH